MILPCKEMKESFANINIAKLCRWFGISRQAYYQHEWKHSKAVFEYSLVLEEINEIRARHPRIGVRKLQELLHPFLEEQRIKMGRDALFDFLSNKGMLVRKRKRQIKTTYSYHWLKKYTNLIIDFIPSKPNQLWVSDITYWKIGDIWFYISLITDAYSRKIVGYHLSETLHAEQTIKALNMAFLGLKENVIRLEELIHHSDRGVQYCSSSYVNQLKKKNINISMTQSGDPLENAIAERVNGIIKDEYLLNYQCSNIKEARNQLAIAVSLYNKERPHSSIGNLTPEFVHSQYHQIEREKIKKLWKNYYTKRTIFVNSKQD
jgi:transposase InsO family protein